MSEKKKLNIEEFINDLCSDKAEKIKNDDSKDQIFSDEYEDDDENMTKSDEINNILNEISYIYEDKCDNDNIKDILIEIIDIYKKYLSDN